MVMLRPGGKASRIYKQVSSQDSNMPKKKIKQSPKSKRKESKKEERNSQPMRRIPNSQSVQEPSFSTNARRVIVDTSTQAARRVCAVVRCERAHSFDEPRGFAAQQDEGCLIL